MHAGLSRLSLSILIAVSLDRVVAPVSACFRTGSGAAAQSEAKPEMTENCPGRGGQNSPRIIPAGSSLQPSQAIRCRITYIGHSTF